MLVDDEQKPPPPVVAMRGRGVGGRVAAAVDEDEKKSRTSGGGGGESDAAVEWDGFLAGTRRFISVQFADEWSHWIARVVGPSKWKKLGEVE